MIKGQTYQDVMDSPRTVVPTGNGQECRIYFDGKFVGKAPIPPVLFTEDAKWRGFVTPGNEPWRKRSNDGGFYDDEEN